MKINIFYFVLFFIILADLAYSQKPADRAKIIEETNVEQLQEKADKYKRQAVKEKKKAVEMAKQKGWIIRKEFDNGRVMEIQRVENGKPIYYVTYNLNAAKTISTDEVWISGNSGLDLSGSGMKAGVWDESAVRVSHQEFEGRVTQQDDATSLSDHATHLAGTIGAAGIDSDAKGMAYQADINAYDWNSDLSEMNSAAAEGLLVSNHSYGIPAGYSPDGSEWKWYGDESISSEEDYKFGFYNSDCAKWDETAGDARYYQMVVAAGNDRGEGPSDGEHEVDGGNNGYDCISGKALAKNIIAVGAVKDLTSGYQGNPEAVEITNFSSWGPADDGRIKPDISANGKDLYSSLSSGDSQYAYMSGTSMASPAVAGSLLLLQEHYNNLYAEYMKAATLKGLMIHTADEAGANDGPDYKFGWGLMNTQKAAQLISEVDNKSFIIDTVISEGGTFTFQVYSEGNSPLAATMTWTDPAGSPVSAQLDPRDPMLVNDLDMRVEGPSGTVYKPYRLDPENPSNAATKGDNDVDNVEKIEINNPERGIYTISVSHKNVLSSGNQKFSLIVSEIIANSPGNFHAYALDNTSISLSWDQNVDGDDVMVVVSDEKFTGSPQQGQTYSKGDSIGSGMVLYLGQDTAVVHENLQSGTYYHYTAWSVDENNNYSSSVKDSAKTDYDVIFSDDFESDKGWSLSGEFQRDVPHGLGGTEGSPDPSSAYLGTKVLGSDLTGIGGTSNNPDGDYANGLSDREYIAESPVIDCKNYSEVQLHFQRWLNVERPTEDSVHIDISNDGGATWNTIWYNSNEYIENSWNNQSYDIATYADDTGQVKIRYTVGETSSSGNYSGWNIDDLEVTGKIPRHTVTLQVTNGTDPIEDAYVEFDNFTGFTDTLGYIASVGVREGSREYTVRKPGYDNFSDSIDVFQDDSVDVVMNSGTATFEVDFTVLNGDTAVAGTSIDFNNDTLGTDNQGRALFDSIEAGEYQFFLSEGAREDSGKVSVIDRNIDTSLYFHYRVLFNVQDTLSNQIEDASVKLDGYGDSLTNTSGEVVFERVVAESDINYEIAADSFVKKYGTVDVIDSDTSKNITLIPGEKIEFTLKDDNSNLIEGAEIVIYGDTLYSDASGVATIYLANGDYSYKVSADGFYSSSGSISVSGSDITEIITLSEIYNVFFSIDDGENPLNGAELIFAGNSYLTDALGQVSIDTSKGTYDYTLEKEGYYGTTGSVKITDSDVQENISVSKINTIVFEVTHNGNSIEGAEIDYAGKIIYTNSLGEATLDTSNGTYSYTVTKDQYEPFNESVDIMNEDTTLNIELTEDETGIDDVRFGGNISIYPNPTDGTVYIEGDDLNGATIELRNILGNQIMKEILQNRDKISVELEGFSKGIYFIIIQKDNHKYSRKIIFN